VYNQSQKLLVLLDVFNWSKDGLGSQLDPLNYVVEQVEQLYQDSLIDLLEQLQGISRIDAGTQFEDEYGATIEIEEDYLLKEVHPVSYTPLSVVQLDPEIFKYERIRLIYRAVDEFPPLGYPLPDGWNSYPLPVGQGYPIGLVNGGPGGDLSVALSWRRIWIGRPGYSPTHWKYSISPEWIMLLSAHPDSADYWMQEDIWDCWRPSRPEDGAPWYSEDNCLWISKGINDDWVESYQELVSQGYAPNGYRRPLRWLALSDYQGYRFQQLPNNYDVIEIQVRLQNQPNDVRGDSVLIGGPSDGGLIPGLGAQFLEASILSEFLPGDIRKIVNL